MNTHTGTSVSPEPFCSDLSREVGEPMLGTAPTVDVWLALEYNGPWTAKATNNNDLPRSIQTWLAEELALLDNGRLQFIKRSRPALRAGITFFVALTKETAPRLYEFRLSTYDDLLSLDLSAALSGAASYDRYLRAEPLFLVCTNGKRDRCCSRDGLALYHSLVEHVGNAAWQCTHLGGHRYAPTMITLPDGACYGRLTPPDLAPLVQAQTREELLLSHLRGRSCYSDVIQAAESFLRQETGLLARNAYRLLDARIGEGSRWLIRFAQPLTNEVHQITLTRTITDVDRLVSCNPPKMKTVAHFQLVSHKKG